MKQLIQTFLLVLLGQYALAQAPQVMYKGKMSKIGQERRVDGEILVDTIQGKHLYAVGPVEDLRGEIIVWDGKPFVAAIMENQKPYVQKDVKPLKAIFLVYADVQQWDTLVLKNNIGSLGDLQKNITEAAYQHGTDTTTAFPFLLFGKVKEGSGHIMFKDSSVKTVTPDALKAANHKNEFKNQNAQMVGFYSQHHQTIFTHHDSFLHIHYRMANKYQAGHLDMVAFDQTEPVKLLLPHK
jgi:acetolactate decarboxylase